MHNFRVNTRFEGMTLKEVDILCTREAYEKKIEKLKDFGAPNALIENTEQRYHKFIERINNNKYTPQFTYKDGFDKSLLNTIITEYKEEYNRNNKLVGAIINNTSRINFDTRYCPIINKI